MVAKAVNHSAMKAKLGPGFLEKTLTNRVRDAPSGTRKNPPKRTETTGRYHANSFRMDTDAVERTTKLCRRQIGRYAGPKDAEITPSNTRFREVNSAKGNSPNNNITRRFGRKIEGGRMCFCSLSKGRPTRNIADTTGYAFNGNPEIGLVS